VSWRRAVLPSLPWVVCVVSFFFLALGCSENRRGTAKGDRKRQTTKGQGGGWATASTTLLSLKSLCGGGVPSSHRCLRCLFSFFLFLALRLPVFFLFRTSAVTGQRTNVRPPSAPTTATTLYLSSLARPHEARATDERKEGLMRKRKRQDVEEHQAYSSYRPSISNSLSLSVICDL